MSSILSFLETVSLVRSNKGTLGRFLSSGFSSSTIVGLVIASVMSSGDGTFGSLGLVSFVLSKERSLGIVYSPFCFLSSVAVVSMIVSVVLSEGILGRVLRSFSSFC